MPLKNAAAAAAQPGAGAPDLGRIGSLQEALEFIDLTSGGIIVAPSERLSGTDELPLKNVTI
jgi:hypothetical protein